MYVNIVEQVDDLNPEKFEDHMVLCCTWLNVGFWIIELVAIMVVIDTNIQFYAHFNI